jgi:hypothetical protein
MSRLRPAAVAAGTLGLSVLAAACGHSAKDLGPSTAASGSTGSVALAPARTPASAAPALSVAQENRLPGTRAWQLSAKPGSGMVEGYVSEQETQPGRVERFYVNAPRARSVRVELFRMGWYGGRGGRMVLRSGDLPATAQPPCHHDGTTGLTECRWHPTWSVRLPASLVSGVYIGKLVTSARAQKDTLFVVRAPRPGPLLAQLETSTYEAYNDWGGDDLYPSAQRVTTTGSTQGVAVSYDRPYDTITGAGQLFARDIAMVRFLEREGYPVTYTTDTGVDLHPRELLGARAVLDIGHSEYWSQRAHAAYAAARDAGVSLAFFTSDTMGWRVRFGRATRASSEAGHPDHVIVAYKEHALLDPDRAQPSGRFPDGGASVTATLYENCITPRLGDAAGPPLYAYYGWSPSPTLTPRWLFAGTGFTGASIVPGIVGYELDRVAPLPPAPVRLIGGGAAVCQGRVAGSDRTYTTLYRARSGALVFSSGTMGWQLGLSPLPATSPDAPRAADPRLVRLTENLLARMLGASHRAVGRSRLRA